MILIISLLCRWLQNFDFIIQQDAKNKATKMSFLFCFIGEGKHKHIQRQTLPCLYLLYTDFFKEAIVHRLTLCIIKFTLNFLVEEP
jgi:hypothetical protein